MKLVILLKSYSTLVKIPIKGIIKNREKIPKTK